MSKRHVLSVLVENEPGVLSRVAGLFSGRGFNIHSLNVAPALEEGVSHMTITTEGDSLILEQIMKQLHKIVSVIKVVDFADIAAVERAHLFALVLQGLRIAIPAALLLAMPAEAVQDVLNMMPEWLKGGMAVGGGMVVAVGYAMVINMMATREVWPFFALGFVFAAVSDFTLIGLGTIGVAIALIYLNLSKKGGNGGGSVGSGDPIGDILEDY